MRPISTVDWQPYDKLVLWALLGALLVRIGVLLASPLSLGVDEAQYWVWSQTPDFGYYSKPPLIAWIIGISHAIFGHHSWAVRLPAPLLHFGIALTLWRAASLLYGPVAGRLAALIWTLMPAVGLGGLIISTDSPMLLGWSGGLLCLIYADRQAEQETRWLFAAGLCTGFAMLGKYAALYFLLGYALYLLIMAKKDGFTTSPLKKGGLVLAGFLIAASPNLIWNLFNGFVTFQHLGENANLAAPAYSPAQLGRFISSQFMVFGPVMLVLGVIAALRLPRHRLFLLCLSLPVLCIMMGQAYLKEANANWAVAAYPALTLLVAGWLSDASGRRSARARATLLGLAINGGLIMVLSVGMAAGDFGSLTPKSDPLRRLRGWEAMAQDLQPHLERYKVQTVLADSRAAAAILPFHLYPLDITVRLYDHDGRPSNHFERAFNFTADSALPALAITAPDQSPVPAFVEWQGPVGTSDHKISTRRARQKDFYIGF